MYEIFASIFGWIFYISVQKQFWEEERVDESDFHKFIADFLSLFECKI